MDYLASFYGIISGGNMQINNVSARNHIHRTILSQYHTMTCNFWLRRRCSHCRWWLWSDDGHIRFCFPQNLGAESPEGHCLWTQPQNRRASFLESYCPVGIVLAHRRIDVEAAGAYKFWFNSVKFEVISQSQLLLRVWETSVIIILNSMQMRHVGR